MMNDERLNHLEKVYCQDDAKTDTTQLIAEVRRLRAALGAIAALDMLVNPNTELMMVYRRLMDAVARAHNALGTVMRGPGVLMGTSGPASNNEAQKPVSQPSQTTRIAPGEPKPAPMGTLQPGKLSPPKIET